MKSAILILSFLFLFLHQGAAQSSNGLLINNFKNQQSRVIQEGSKITIKKDGQTYKGKFQIVSQEALAIGSDTINLSQIDELFAKTSSSNLGGSALSILGIWAGAGGLAGTVAVAAEGSFALVLIPFTASIAALGTFGAIKGIQLLSRGKKYKSFKWEYTMIIPTSPAVVLPE
ncbi:hypothetical protein [Sunxiuqinia sp. sy24]|uniref:hypothetical protein n=1 Tax=Sunxiuqinia sp. sy24 TaxID=3461495 RepID=UPI0040465679